MMTALWLFRLLVAAWLVEDTKPLLIRSVLIFGHIHQQAHKEIHMSVLA